MVRCTRIEVSWTEMKAMLDGTDAALPYTEGVTGKGDEELVVFDGVLAYVTVLTESADKAAWAALKPSANVYLGQGSLYGPDGVPFKGQKPMAGSVPVTMASDQPAIRVTLAPPTSEASIAALLDTGGSPDMVVDGTTPVVFSFDADASDDIQVHSLRLVFSATFFDFDGGTFGKGGGVLANGVSVDIVANDGTFVGQLAKLVVNEDFMRLLEFSISQAGSTDALAASLPFGGNVVLVGGTADKITVAINDNLTEGSRGINYFTSTLYGVKS